MTHVGEEVGLGAVRQLGALQRHPQFPGAQVDAQFQFLIGPDQRVPRGVHVGDVGEGDDAREGAVFGMVAARLHDAAVLQRELVDG